MSIAVHMYNILSHNFILPNIKRSTNANVNQLAK